MILYEEQMKTSLFIRLIYFACVGLALVHLLYLPLKTVGLLYLVAPAILYVMLPRTLRVEKDRLELLTPFFSWVIWIKDIEFIDIATAWSSVRYLTLKLCPNQSNLVLVKRKRRISYSFPLENPVLFYQHVIKSGYQSLFTDRFKAQFLAGEDTA